MKRLAPLLLLALATPAFAGPADDAHKHFQAIAAGDLAALSSAYAENARLEWVGGPLDGAYAGSAAIQGVWEKFARAQGPLTVAVARVEESANPKGSTVSAHVMFTGKAPIKVRYVLTYRDGKIASETWQIDPKLAIQ
ncbi:MAG: nuclear transport factor 2 family protein [Deltaproteobacteria bacterium]|nr:nuclear transport factor 2 family protein [Deltaproteobacteria bacterium]